MAKKNIIHLIGYIDKVIQSTEESVLISLKIQKDDKKKFVFPLVELPTSILVDDDKIECSNAVFIDGILKTESVKFKKQCPSCGKEMASCTIITKVVANKVFFLNPTQNDAYLNKVLLLGSLCKTPEFKYIKGTHSPISNMKYQLAVNGTLPNESNYPWISTFARQANEDKKRLKVGSQIMVDGALITRYTWKERLCEHCGESNIFKEFRTEVQGLSIEYLNNCLFL